MAKDRARDDRRSVGSHEKMTAALGKAAGWTRTNVEGTDFAVKADKEGKPSQEQIVGEHKDAAFAPGKSTMARYGSTAAVKTAYKSISK